MKTRIPLSSELKDKLLVECGYKCSVPNCNVAQSLEFHHIDGDPAYNDKDNIVVLCAVHHHQADIGKITRRALSLMKKIQFDIDGTLKSSAQGELIEITIDEITSLLDVARQMPNSSLRIISREFIRYLLNIDSGYYCRDGIDYNDFLLKHGLVTKQAQKAGPSLFKISEKGKLLCKFIYTSQYNLPSVCFDPNVPMDIERINRVLGAKAMGYACFGQLSKEKASNT